MEKDKAAKKSAKEEKAKEKVDKKKDKKDKKKSGKHPSKADKKKATDATGSSSAERVRELIVLDGRVTNDWVKLFENDRLKDGSRIRVVQASWMETSVAVYSDAGCMMSIAPIRESEGKVTRPNWLGVKPDFLLIRNQVRGPTPASDNRNTLYGLMMAGVPAINTLQSEYMNLERPIMYGVLREIQKRVGADKFPLIPINFYSSHTQMAITPDMPAVMKVSHAHAGMGKIKLDETAAFRDMATVLALNNNYCTSEPFIDAEYGLRVQKIGNHYRVYKKVYTGSGWKSQFGGSDLQLIEINDRYKLWVDECAKAFGGMDLLAVDALKAKDGQEYIIELNGTAIGLTPGYEAEDTEHIHQLTLERMNSLFCADE